MTTFNNNVNSTQGIFVFKTDGCNFISKADLKAGNGSQKDLTYHRFKDEIFDLIFCLNPKGENEAPEIKAIMTFSVSNETKTRPNDETFALLVQHAYKEFIHRVNDRLRTSFPKLRLYDVPDFSITSGRLLRTVDADVL